MNDIIALKLTQRETFSSKISSTYNLHVALVVAGYIAAVLFRSFRPRLASYIHLLLMDV